MTTMTTSPQARGMIGGLLPVSGWLLLGITAVGELQAIRPFAVFALTLTGLATVCSAAAAAALGRGVRAAC